MKDLFEMIILFGIFCIGLWLIITFSKPEENKVINCQDYAKTDLRYLPSMCKDYKFNK